ncbi:hypothetical protein JCM30237_03910 [Halolamina litorea]|uniref:Uncharacterized protein n=1 Tax=Halolamina litorea TaxID=1515593 RepID=A0ABD6BQ21_9EURY|nr:hypothetical protein [Halolamina litorea]
MQTTDRGVFGRLPERYAHAYLVVAFFVLPALAVVLSGGGVRRPPGPVPTALLALVVVHHGLFVVVSVLLD